QTGRNLHHNLSVWELTTGQETLQFPRQPLGLNYAFSFDGKQLLIWSNDSAGIKVWDLVARKEIFTLKGQSPVVPSPDGRHLVTIVDSDTPKLWDLATGQEARSLQRAGAGIERLTFSSDSKWLAGGASDNSVRV